jgi:hypothetical protein
MLFFGLILTACQTGDATNQQKKKSTEKRAENECPKGHSDEVVPIIYGYPSEEDFKNSDSGKVVLGGCELPENPKKYWCKKHKTEF